MKDIIRKVADFLKFCKETHVTTIAGGLAYFLFSGLIPFLGLLYSIARFFGIGESVTNGLVSFIFGGVATIEYEIEQAAASKATTLILAAVSVYSSAHFYFHLLRAGERIYNEEKHSGLLKRIISFIYVIAVEGLMIVAVTVSLFGGRILSFFGFSSGYISFLHWILGMASNFALAFLLHKFAAPRHIGVKKIICGTMVSFVLWVTIGFLFGLYVNGVGKGGGMATLSSVVLFTLYLYLMMQGLTYGIALNAYKEDGT